ncbi:MAG: NAD(P)H-dependent oxidoreductase [Chloroflexi bacterium]|nr:NAD(P)H-dependent oxidoreductase [Chloroflexota bacterium]
MPTTILGLGGSLRPGSTTTLALRIALDGAAASGATIHHLDLAEFPLPMFNGTYSLEAYSPAERQTIEQLFDAIANAQGIILASPTYHNTISGAMKNALDLLEIGTEDLPPRMAGKVVGLVTVQGGTSGTGNNTLTTMLLAARAMHAWVAPTMVSVPGSRSAFNTDGQIFDTVIDTRLRALGAQVASASEVFAALTVK